MKKLVLLSFVAVLAIVALSSFVRLNHKPENKLAKNKDFINWVTGMTNLKAKIEETNTKTAFIKYLERKNSIADNKILASKMGYASELELTTAFNQINTYSNNFIKATPELQTPEGENLYKEALMQVPSCDDIYQLATFQCGNYLAGPNPNQAAYENCIHIATLNWIRCGFIEE